MKEEWKRYGRYSVSNFARVYNQYGKIVKPTVLIGDDGKPISINRVVATLFIPNPNNWKFVVRKDKDPNNNSADNLRWSPSASTLGICINYTNGEKEYFISAKTCNEYLGLPGRYLYGVLRREGRYIDDKGRYIVTYVD